MGSREMVLLSIKRLGAIGGVDLQRIENTLARARQRLFVSRGTDLVIDVGANRGQYASKIRNEGYRGRIISFEPIPEAFESLRQASKGDAKWDIRSCALGKTPGVMPFHVSENLFSSSLLDVTSQCTDVIASTRAVKSINVDVQTLDQAIGVDDLGKRIHLKVDTQGSELDVLLGAQHIFDQIDTIECELSLVSLYAGQPLFPVICQHLYSAGFVATWMERGFTSQNGEMLQIDALFRRGT